MSGIVPQPVRPIFSGSARCVLHLVQRLQHRLRYAPVHNFSDAGFTLIEAVVSLIVFVIAAVAGTTAITYGISISNSTRNRVAAVNLAQSQISRWRTDEATLIANPTPAATTTRGYTVTTRASVPVVNAVTCPVSAAIALTVTVSWPDAGVRRTLRMDTSLACGAS